METLVGKITGRPPAALVAECVRELGEEDLLLRRHTPVSSESRPIAKLRYQHHKLAQLLAQGTPPGEASLITGYAPSRISILQADPAFKELLAHYVGVNQQVYADLQARMAGFAVNALDELQDRLEDRPEVFTNKELLEAAKVGNDRGGNNPVQRVQSTQVILTAADIAEIKKEVKGLENGHIIEAIPALENSTGLTMGSAARGITSTVLEEAKTQGESGEGQDL